MLVLQIWVLCSSTSMRSSPLSWKRSSMVSTCSRTIVWGSFLNSNKTNGATDAPSSEVKILYARSLITFVLFCKATIF